jgi:methionyl-tRNA formyltransferase
MTGGPAEDSRVRTLFLGSGGFGRATLRRLADRDDVHLVGVVTAPKRPAGRRQRPRSSAIEDLATGLGITSILMPERLRAPESTAAVLALESELLVLADYGQIVPAALLDSRHGALNLHPSLLPRHRGATPIPAAILAGDTETGVSLIRMDTGLDTGPIVAQTRVPLDGTETAPALEEALEAVAADLLDENLAPWIRGELEARPQDATGATLTRGLTREDGRLDPTRPADQLARQVRAYQPWPGSFVDTVAGRIVVWDATAAPSGPGAGRFDQLGLATLDGMLVLREVQPAGGTRMPWADLVRGRPSILGSTVVPGP